MKKRKDKLSENSDLNSADYLKLSNHLKAAESEIIMLKDRVSSLTNLNVTKDKFFSIIAHDLKSPFSSILGFSELIIERAGINDFSDIQTFAQYIQTSSSHAMNLLTNLLEWSRFQTGRMAFKPENISLRMVLDDVLDLLNEQAIQKSISIMTEVDNNYIVYADRAMLNTILRNLISNSIKYTHPDGKISVSAYTANNESVITVKDSGIGMSHEDIEKLFKIEECTSSKGTTGEEGTGLGLFICNEFVKKHGGEICIESEFGAGSEFLIRLPLSL